MWLKLSMRSLCVIFADSLARFSSNFLICTRDRSTHHSARQSEHRDHSVRWGMSACTAIPVHLQLAAVETAHLLVPLLLVGRARVGNVERRACLLHFLLARGLLPFRPRDSDLGAALLLLSARTHVESDTLVRPCAHSNTPLGPESSARPMLEQQRQRGGTSRPRHGHCRARAHATECICSRHSRSRTRSLCDAPDRLLELQRPSDDILHSVPPFHKFRLRPTL